MAFSQKGRALTCTLDFKGANVSDAAKAFLKKNL